MDGLSGGIYGHNANLGADPNTIIVSLIEELETLEAHH